MRDRNMKNVLEAFLQMISAMSQEVGTMSRVESFTHVEDCLLLVDEIRITCMEAIKNMAVLEKRLLAAGLIPPKPSGDGPEESS